MSVLITYEFDRQLHNQVATVIWEGNETYVVRLKNGQEATIPKVYCTPVRNVA